MGTRLRRDGSERRDRSDLTPGARDKTNDSVRIDPARDGPVPLLTREGEVAIAQRIERGAAGSVNLATPTIAKRI